jgi:crotonobetainyl-CoA:carnitine CoA-transferase CaiB-like acyl-CoA transferase
MAAGPLKGVRVVDLTRVWAGPLASRILADLGADVIKVEAPNGRGPAAPRPGGNYPDGDPGQRPWNRQGSFNKLNRNKRSLVLDLKSHEGRATFLALVGLSDVVIENFSAGTMDDLGIGYDALSDARPDVVYLSMPGFGSSGPYRDYVAYGPSIEPKTGLPWFFGYGDGLPHMTALALPDATAGTTAAAAVLTALARRRLTGHGAHVDLSQQEGFIPFLAGYLTSLQVDPDYEPIPSNRSRLACPSGVFEGRDDDDWIALAVTDHDQWLALCAEAGRDWHVDPRFSMLPARRGNEDELEREIGRWSREHDAAQLASRLRDRGIPAEHVATGADLLADGHLRQRRFFVDLDQPDVGPRPYPGCPVLIDEQRHIDWSPAPTLGQHNEEILTGVLGYDRSEVARLSELGVIADRPPQ